MTVKARVAGLKDAGALAAGPKRTGQSVAASRVAVTGPATGNAEPPTAKVATGKPSRKRTSSIALAKHRKADTLVRDLRVRAEALLANADRLLHRLS